MIGPGQERKEKSEMQRVKDWEEGNKTRRQGGGNCETEEKKFHH